MKHNVRMTRPNSEGEQRSWTLMSAEQAQCLPWYKRWARYVYLKFRYDELEKHPALAALPREVAKRYLKHVRRRVIRSQPIAARAVRGLSWLLLAITVVYGMYLHRSGTSSIYMTLIVWLTASTGATWATFISNRTKRIVHKRTADLLGTGRFTYCVTCDYNLRNSTSDTCPECGTPVTVELWREANAEPAGVGDGPAR